MAISTKRVPYSRSPEDLLHPGRATDFLRPPAQHQRTAVYTFGCPRVGDEEFVASLATVRHERYAGVCDLVSWVPPRFVVPYVHHGIFHCIDREGTVHTFGAGEAGHDDGEALRASCKVSLSSHSELFLRLIARQVPVELMSDDAPINYTSGVWGLR